MDAQAQTYPPVPPDNKERELTQVNPDQASGAVHLGVVGDTYTILLSGEDTAGRFCLVDMLVPPGGGPGPHRHDFEETFVVLEGEVEATFRGEKRTVRAGDTINIPANAPHQFHNVSSGHARLLCTCSPAGQEKFFEEVGVKVDSRTSPAPKLDEAQKKDFLEKATALAPKYRTEMLKEA